jgi:hypothetical protein
MKKELNGVVIRDHEQRIFLGRNKAPIEYAAPILNALRE